MSTYAVPYIMGEIKRFLRDDGLVKVSRSVKDLGVKIKQIKEEHLRKTGKEMNISEIEKILHISKQEIAVAIDSSLPVESIDEEVYTNKEEIGESKISKISNNRDEANTLINKLFLNELINELSPKEKQIIILRYYKEKTQSEIAKMLRNITSSGVKN